MVYGVLMAGGIGSRFWPRSRIQRPKQFLRVLGDHTLLQSTYLRLQGLVLPENTWVVTHERYTALTRDQLPQIPAEQVLGEPISRNTAPCIAYAAMRLHAVDPEGVMIALPADHLIRNVEAFRDALRVAVDAARNADALVTIGIQPTHPETGYGYIQFESMTEQSLMAYPVRTFAEKPDIATAKRFLDSGDFLWNSGIFVWRIQTILDQMKLHLRKVYDPFAYIASTLNTGKEADAVQEAYQKCPRISIDYGVMEQANRVLVVPGSFGWSDIGDWQAVYDMSDKDKHGNVLRGTAVVHHSSRCHVEASRLVVCVGMHDAIVVETDDAILVCQRESAQQVRNVVAYMRAHGLERFV